jgi:hypothetical protein
MIECWRSTQRLKAIGTVIIKVQQYLIPETPFGITFPNKLGAINVINHKAATDLPKR